MDKNLTELLKIDRQYSLKEDKNYYLVHKYNELIKNLNEEDIETLKKSIFSNFDYTNHKSFLEYVCSVCRHQDIKEVVVVKNKCRDKLSIIDFYEEFDDNLISFIKGHLFLENAINKVLGKIKLDTNETFANKINILFNNKRINKKTKVLLVEINRVRNKIAHNLYYELTFDTMFKLVKLSSEAGIDYSDDTIFENKRLSFEWYNVSGIILELFPNTFSHLFEINEELFPNNEIFDFIT